MQRPRRVLKAGRAGSGTAGCSGPGGDVSHDLPGHPVQRRQRSGYHPAGLVHAGEQDDRQSFLPRHPPITRAAGDGCGTASHGKGRSTQPLSVTGQSRGPVCPEFRRTQGSVTGSCGVFMRYGRIRPLGSCGRQADAVVLGPRDRVPPGSFLPPPPDDPLPGGQVKGTLPVSLRDRCATPDMPLRSQDRQLSGSGRETRQALPAPGARLHGSTGTARQSVQAMILHIP